MGPGSIGRSGGRYICQSILDIVQQIGHARIFRSVRLPNQHGGGPGGADTVIDLQGQGHVRAENAGGGKSGCSGDFVVAGGPDPGGLADLHAGITCTAFGVEPGLDVNMAVSQNMAVHRDRIARGEDHVALLATGDEVAFEEAVLAKVQDDGAVDGLQERGPVEIEVCIRSFDDGDVVVGEDRAGDIEVSHRVFLRAENHLGAGGSGDDIERPARFHAAAVSHGIQAQHLGMDTFEISAAIGVRERGQDPEIVLAGEEDLTVLELYLDDGIGLAAHGHRVVAEELGGWIVPVKVTVEIPVVRLVERGLEIEHQVHDHVLDVISRSLCGGQRHLAHDLLGPQVYPEHEGHIVGQNTVIGGTVGDYIIFVGQDRQPQEVLVL